MATRGSGGGRGSGRFRGDGRGRWPGGLGGDDGGHWPGGRGGGGGGYPHPYRRRERHQHGGDEGGGLGVNDGGLFQDPHRNWVGGRGRGRGRGRGEVLDHPTVPLPGHPVPGTAPVPPPPPLLAASSSSSPAPPPGGAATASALAREMGKLDVVGPAPPAPAPAASPGASAPAAKLEEESSASKRIAHLARPGYGTRGRKIEVRANHFLVDVAQNEICHYDVKIIPEPKARRTNRVLLKKLVEVHAATFLDGRTPAYDGSKSLYTAGELPKKLMKFVVKLGNEGRENKYDIEIRYVGRANVNHLKQFIHRRQRDLPQDTIQALDVVLRESPSLNYVTVSRSFSDEFGQADIGKGLECWRGFYQSLRPTQMGLSLNIDVSSTAFYKPILVTEFVKDFIGRKYSGGKTDPKQPIADSDRLMLRKALRGVRVETTHGKKSVYKITAITSAPLAQLNFSLNEEGQITVVQYFASRYHCQLEYTAWPCLQSGNDSKPIYLPMEVCQIIKGQRYPKKLTPEQEKRMVGVTCEGPQQRKNSILGIVGGNNYSADTGAQRFGITVVNEMTKVQARLLHPPALKYHEPETFVPIFGKWNMFNKKMVKGGCVQSWTCLNFSDWSKDRAQGICHNLARKCNSMGMDFKQNSVTEIRSAHSNKIGDALRDVNKRAPDLKLLIVILPNATGHYGKIKRLCETELGIVSQCINPNKFKEKDQYYENVALKINVKVGGRNAILGSGIAKNILFDPDTATIIFGADVTHPAAGEDSSASIAAVVASIDREATTYKALISDQPHRQEIIQDLFWTRIDPEKGIPVNGGMIRELLLSFYQKTSKKPERIIFYRDGVSEGQFTHVLLDEMPAIRKACDSMGNGYLPKVTFIVVQKRHHTRVFPEGRENCDNENILPGTVVDEGICHPSEFDFYLCSHTSIKGTSRPIHYHVLYDENSFSADDLQMFTNDLCYTYARCTRSLSVVPPVHYAHLAAARARYYDERDGTDAASVLSGRGGPPARLPQVKENVKDVMFFC